MKYFLILMLAILIQGCGTTNASTRDDSSKEEIKDIENTSSLVEKYYQFSEPNEGVSTLQKNENVIIPNQGDIEINYGKSKFVKLLSKDIYIVRDAYDHYIIATFNDDEKYNEIANAPALVVKHTRAYNFVGFANIQLPVDDSELFSSLLNAFSNQVVVNNPSADKETDSTSLTYTTDEKDDGQEFKCTVGGETSSYYLSHDTPKIYLQPVGTSATVCVIEDIEMIRVAPEKEMEEAPVEDVEEEEAPVEEVETASVEEVDAAPVVDSLGLDKTVSIKLIKRDNRLAGTLNLRYNLEDKNIPNDQLSVVVVLTSTINEKTVYESTPVDAGRNRDANFTNIAATTNYQTDYYIEYKVTNKLTNETSILQGRVKTATVYGEYERPDNFAPTARDDSVSTSHDRSISIEVLSNDTDTDGDAISIEANSVSKASHGTVSQSGNTLTYTPNKGYVGSDTFTYEATDGTDTNDATVTIEITNADPVAVADTVSTDINTTVTIPVLSNDSDGDDDTLSITSLTSAFNGTIEISGVNIIYTPNSDFSGNDTFSYTISDGITTSSAGVNVSVQ